MFPGAVSPSVTNAASGRADTARDAVVAGKLQTNDESAPAGRAQRCDHFRHEPRPPVPVAAKLVIPPVRMWREELMKQVTMPAGNLDAGKTTILQVDGGGCDFLDQAADLGGGQGSRDGPREVVGQGGRTDRFRIAPREVASAPGVLDLTDQPATLALDGFCKSLGDPPSIVLPPDLNPGQAGLMARHAQGLRNATAKRCRRHGSRMEANLAFRDATFGCRKRGDRRA